MPQPKAEWIGEEQMNEKLLDYATAAEILGCTPRMVRKLVETRQLGSIKVGRLVRISVKDIEEYVHRQRRPAAA